MSDDLFEDPRKIALYVVGIIVVSIGVTGNVLVVTAVWKKRSLQTTTNYLLVNLAASDLTTLISCAFMTIPNLIDLKEGTLADLLCKVLISYHLPFTASIVSILTLTVVSVERYNAVVKPMNVGIRLREENVKYANIGIWTVGIVLTIPLYIFGYYEAPSQSCRHTDETKKTVFVVYQISLVIIGIIIPFFVISFCYFQIVRELYFKNKVGPQNVAAEEDARAKRKLVKLSLTVTGVFAICLFPLAITVMMRYIDNKAFGKSYKIAAIPFFAQPGINPLIYSFKSTNFRQAFKEILKCR